MTLGKKHPCLTGECYHQMRAECDDALGEYIEKLEGALDRIAQTPHDSLCGSYTGGRCDCHVGIATNAIK